MSKHPAKAFLEQVEAFLKRSGMPAYKFGSLSVGDPNLVIDLRAGRMPSLRLVGRVQSFIASHDKKDVA